MYILYYPPYAFLHMYMYTSSSYLFFHGLCWLKYTAALSLAFL